MGETQSEQGAQSAAQAAPPARIRLWPILAGFGYLLAVAGIGIAHYPAVPDPMPVHFDAAFQPDAWAAKSVGGFLLPVFIGLGATLLMWVLAALLPVLDALGGSQPHPAAGMQLSPRAPATTQTLLLTRRMLERLALSVALLIGTVALLTWFGVPGWAAPWAFILLMGGFLGVLAFGVVGIVRSERAETYKVGA
ncbi:DUF1648 domain-containing protein [Microterricola viridarii]|uniref:DUF1648 domain-containing protein n=1 Tax=Microterricola viridarii TaxID=412690 RepID=A0A1H1XT07_9MICO|nr:DUF1648 domain-containing protein [Microterricola viridarii]SDT11886.1 Protein of unknown function [Microterricola viridarii]